MRKFAATLVVAFGLVGVVPTAQGAECVGVSYPDQTTVGGETLKLNGLGIREATIFSVDVYVAALYVPSKSEDGAAIAASNKPKKLEMQFVRGVERKKIVDSYKESFAKEKGDVSGSIDAEIDKFLGWMSAVEDGDTMGLTYVPGEGVDVSLKGTKKGTIESEAFAEALFLIWLGDSPPNAGLKTGLLGGPCG